LSERLSLSAAVAPKHQEFIIGHATLIQGPFLETISNGAVHVRENRIVAVGPTATIKAKAPEAAFFDASSFIMIPGLFNAHTHVAMGFFRGLGHCKENMIETVLFPAEKSLSPDILQPLSYSYIYDGLRAGVTSFVDHYYFSFGVARAFETFGVRGWIGETVADLGGAFPGRESWNRAKELIESSSFGPLISHLIAPHAADTVSVELLKECADYARQNKIPLHMHLSQTPGERERVKNRDHLSPVAKAAKAGALSESSLVVHLTSADSDDLKIVKDSGATVGYCPTSTLFYDRLARIEEFYELGIPLAIGSDCAASNDSADILSELKIAELLARDHRVPNDHLSPDHLLAMATTIPAKVLGRQKDLGTIESGKLADLVLLKRSLISEPLDQPLANVIYSMGSRDVSHVMVNGNWALWNREIPDWDESQLLADYREAVNDIRGRIQTKAR
jgi:5-methylthioadenosine/S-adenosylhomocysteine deaminase